jgi:hypothetical protein
MIGWLLIEKDLATSGGSLIEKLSKNLLQENAKIMRNFVIACAPNDVQ